MARRSWLHLALLALVAASAFQQVAWAEEDEGVEDTATPDDENDEYADVERAHLVVRKYIKEEYVVQGRNVTVYIDIYNGGVK